jgi:23S rRNA (uracil1939-C5)-methyltransferase
MADVQYRKGDVISLQVIDLAEKDSAVGRLESGITVMLSGMVAIGDHVSARITKVRQRYLEAATLDILEPSPERTTPVCSYFGVCGGCKLMHVCNEAQLRYKQKKVSDALKHLGDFVEPPVTPVLAGTSPLHYRNKMEFSFAAKRYLMPEELSLTELSRSKEFALGFHTPGNFEKVIDIDYCYLARNEMNQVLELTRRFALQHALPPYSVKTHTGFLRNLVVRFSEHTQELMVNLVTSWHDTEVMARYSTMLHHAMPEQKMTVINNITSRKNGVATGEEEVVISGEGFITERLCGLDFRISANSFFQTNSSQAEVLYQTLLAVADLQSTDTVYDLYCGTGTITLCMAAHCHQVIGLEVVESAIRDAQNNALRNGITNAHFLLADLKDFHTLLPLLEEHGKPRVIVTDPPRAGMHPKALATMVQLQPERIIYVSCNPASLARDGKELAAQGYSLRSVQPVEMFPQTNHIESVACFVRV